jgi:multidrug efflux pump subunit AcrA (membrane-fusion protein)
MKALNRKLWRDLLHLRGQAFAVALVVACGIASFVTSRSAYVSLKLSQETYYERYRFAAVFGQLKRAPDMLVPRIAAIPGVRHVQTRVVAQVTLDVPGLDEPATGRLVSIPERRTPMLNDLFIRRGRYIAPGQREEILVSEAFAEANKLMLGDTLGAVMNGRWERLRIVGIALSPEYVYEIRGAGDIFPDNKRFGILWMGRDALGTAFDMDGAFNDVALSLMPGAKEEEVISHLDLLLARYGGLGAYGRYHHTSHRFLAEEMKQLQVNAAFVPPLFLGVAAFLLHVVLSRLISTQRDQIAVLKAFGYGHLTISLHYLQLVLGIVFAGTIIGSAAGLWFGARVTRNYAQFFRFPLLHYVDAEGKTRVRKRFVISAPVTGRLVRMALDAGDRVEQEMVVARIDPLPYDTAVQEARARLAELRAQRAGVETQRPKPEALDQAQARITAAQEAQREAEARVTQAQAAFAQAQRQYQRATQLETKGTISREERETAELLQTTRAKELEIAQRAVQRTASEVKAAQAALAVLEAERRDPDYLLAVYDARIKSVEAELAKLRDEAVRTEIRSPIRGHVLRVLEENERVVAAGTPLLELGNLADLEIMVDVLSTDAVKIQPGAMMFIEHWGSERVLQAQVRLVEPSAFTKISALGVEEQRVNVIADFVDAPTPLGDNYRVEARIVIWEEEDVLKVPLSALFRCAEAWCVFVVKDGKAYRRKVVIGHRNNFEAEVLKGLVEDAVVILHPSDQVREDRRVEPR